MVEALALDLTRAMVKNGVASGDIQWMCRLGSRYLSLHFLFWVWLFLINVEFPGNASLPPGFGEGGTGGTGNAPAFEANLK